jgi:hypothetical protein
VLLWSDSQVFFFILSSDAVRKKFPEVSDAEIRTKISRYLTGAGDRDGGRKMRSKQSEIVITSEK